MRKLVLVLIAVFAVVTFIRAFANAEDYKAPTEVEFFESDNR